MNHYYIVIYFFILITSCNTNKDLRVDFHSFSEPNLVVTQHLDLDIDVDFERKIIKGVATYKIKNIFGSKKLVLDSNGLIIKKVTSQGENCNYNLGKTDSILGQGLYIDISKNTKEVSIYYESDPKAKSLQWLSPNQTAGKKHPFLFTQSQTILARTWIPCQDSPGVRFTYTAKVKVPPNLMAVMSAENPTEKNEQGFYEFKMDQPIPSYLLALAVGDINFQSIGKNTGIYAEPQIIEKAAYEFAETEKMLKIAETIYGSYEWGKYDILVLPPSFPFGGMENPRLTFVTPTILAGDRSLTSLIAHELAHSWSGNLVTNKTWDDFWLNEGFTVYFERRIIEQLEGRNYSDMLSLLGKQDLENEIKYLGDSNKDTHLKLNLFGRDPDNVLTDIAYEKGFFLLRLIEETVGRKQFDSFLKKYFSENSFKAIDTEEFITYLNKYLLNKNPKAKEKILLNQWVYGPGIPKNCPHVKSSKLKGVDKAIISFQKGYSLKNITNDNWSSHEWLHFLRHLPKNITIKELKLLDQTFKFTQSENIEILSAWFLITIPADYPAIQKPLERFLKNVGRRKFLKPIYEALFAKKPVLAIKIYKNARPNYHPVSQQTLDELFFKN